MKLETQITLKYRVTLLSVYCDISYTLHRHSADRKKQTKKRVLKERKSNEGDEGEEAQWMTPKQINNRQANKTERPQELLTSVKRPTMTESGCSQEHGAPR